MIKTLSERFEGRMLIGAGTVLNREQILLTKEAGGRFIISPDVNEEVIKETKKAGLVSIPGALTPSEATLATRAGADFVKLFPVSQLGPSYVKALCAPLSHIRFLAVGGVTLGNIRELINSGACGVGIGVSDSDKDAIWRGDFDAIEKKCSALTDAIGGKK
jgi:2-dehydro-3-deoxyphosphogluconate aldolase/(4S)-4-hydroxy-2-oxoglutarate aldolase